MEKKIVKRPIRLFGEFSFLSKSNGENFASDNYYVFTGLEQ